MKASVAASIVLGLVLNALVIGQAQRQPSPDPPFGTTTHILFGDLLIAEPEGGIPGAPVFIITLERLGGSMVARDSIPANGRFRFNNVQNGEYILKVRLDTSVVYQEQLLLAETRSTDIRKNIELAWKGEQPLVGGTIYARSAPNTKRLQEAREAIERGNLKVAEGLLKQIVKEDSRDYEAWTELGTAQFLNKKLDDAEKSYQQALLEENGYLPALVNLGKVQVASARFDQAIDPLTQAVKLEPNRAETQYLLGEAYLGIKKGSQAVGFLNEAIRLDPEGMADVHLRLAQLYDRAGLKDRAANEYRQYLDKKPDSQRRNELEKYIAQFGESH